MKTGNDKIRRDALTQREAMTMKIVWDHSKPISAVEIQQELAERYGISYERSTITTFILHLRQKGFIDSYKKGQIHYYVPIVPEAEYIADQTRQFADFWFDGSAAKMIAAYASDDNGGISEKEVDEIRRIIDDLDR